jgi:hypothetical protein
MKKLLMAVFLVEMASVVLGGYSLSAQTLPVSPPTDVDCAKFSERTRAVPGLKGQALLNATREVGRIASSCLDIINNRLRSLKSSKPGEGKSKVEAVERDLDDLIRIYLDINKQIEGVGGSIELLHLTAMQIDQNIESATKENDAEKVKRYKSKKEKIEQDAREFGEVKKTIDLALIAIQRKKGKIGDDIAEQELDETIKMVGDFSQSMKTIAASINKIADTSINAQVQ